MFKFVPYPFRGLDIVLQKIIYQKIGNIVTKEKENQPKNYSSTYALRNSFLLKKMFRKQLFDTPTGSETTLQKNTDQIDYDKTPSNSFEDTLKLRFGVSEKQTTARVVLRVRPMKLKTDSYLFGFEEINDDNMETTWVTMDYSFNRANGKEDLEIYGDMGMDSVLPSSADNTEKEMRVNNFLNNLDYFVNNLEGMIWWNGFTMELAKDPKTRLQLVDLEMEPLRLIFQVSSLRELDLIRTVKRLELIGKPKKYGEKPLTFKIRGLNAHKITITTPADGTVVLNFPPFFVLMD